MTMANMVPITVTHQGAKAGKHIPINKAVNRALPSNNSWEIGFLRSDSTVNSQMIAVVMAKPM